MSDKHTKMSAEAKQKRLLRRYCLKESVVVVFEGVSRSSLCKRKDVYVRQRKERRKRKLGKGIDYRYSSQFTFFRSYSFPFHLIPQQEWKVQHKWGLFLSYPFICLSLFLERKYTENTQNVKKKYTREESKLNCREDSFQSLKRDEKKGRKTSNEIK